MNFEYSATSFDTEKLSLELLFENPNHISYNVEPETLKIELKDFRDQDGKLIVKEQTLKKTVPNQLDPGVAATIASAGATAA